MSQLKFQFYLLAFLSSCGNANSSSMEAQSLPIATDTIDYRVLGQQKDGEIVVNGSIDLGNRKCILPEGVMLNFKSGFIKNGTLVGNQTKLKSSQACFDRVRILGSWNVPVIKSTLFRDLSYDNAMKDVVALSDSTVKNKIVIEKGDYVVTAYKNGDVCIPVYSNTDVIIKGTIRITPNDYRNYNIIQLEGNHITIKGNGTIIGDKHTHTGKSGEWGMGINLHNAQHVLIKGITVRDCWGDCIYVGSESTDVRIEDCLLDHGRRQGISITSANGVMIKNCTITNVGGTAPEYGIDVEPNGGDVVDNIVMEKVVAKNCQGGFLVYGKAKNARVGRVAMRNCTVEYNRKMAVKIVKCDAFKMEKCHVRLKSAQRAMDFADIGDVTVVNNTCHFDDKKASTVNPITVNRCGKRRVENNREN